MRYIAALFLLGFMFAITCCETSETSSTAVPTMLRLKWMIMTEPIYWSSPAIDDNGTVYVGSGLHHTDVRGGAFYAVNPDGTLEWEYQLGSQEAVRGSPSIGSDGTLYLITVTKSGSDIDSHLYAFNPDGTLKWKYENMGLMVDPNFREWTPAISSNDVIYVPAAGGLYAINADGTLRWKYSGTLPPTAYVSSPAIAADGTIYTNVEFYVEIQGVMRPTGGIYAINPDGTYKWAYLADGYAQSFPSEDSDGTVYVARGDELANSTYLYALNPDGTLKWRFYTGGLIVMTSPTIDTDGTIYIGTTSKGFAEAEDQAGIFFAINPDGTEKWRYDTTPDFQDRPEDWKSDIYSTAAIGADGVIYFWSESKYIYVFYRDGTLKEKFIYGETSTFCSPTITPDGTIYAGEYHYNYDSASGIHEGAFYAFQFESPGLASTPWPKIHCNTKNTGQR